MGKTNFKMGFLGEKEEFGTSYGSMKRNSHSVHGSAGAVSVVPLRYNLISGNETKGSYVTEA